MKQKSMASNFVFNMLYNAMNLLFPLITIPYVSRALLPGGIGKVNYALNIVTYFMILAQLGIPKYGVREIAKARDDKKELSQTFFEIFSINFVSTAVALVLYYSIILGFQPFPGRTEIFLVAGLSLAFNFMNCDWLYTGLEEYRYVTVRSFLVKLTSLVLILLFVKSVDDAIIYALVYCVGIGGNHLFNVIHARKYLCWPSASFQLKRHLRPIVVLLSTNIAVELYTQLDTTMTGMICGDECVGYYTNTAKLMRLVVTMITTVGAILLPRLSYHYKNGNRDIFNDYIAKALKIILYFSIPAMIGIFFLSEPIVRIALGEEFLPSSITLKILCFLIPVLAVGNLFGSQILMITNHEAKLMKSVMAGAVVNLILNSFLIPIYQQNGAAIGSVIAELTVMTLQICYASKYVSICVGKKYVISLLGANVMIGAGTWFLRSKVTFGIMNLAASVLGIAAIYFALSLAFQNESATYLTQRCKGMVMSICRRKNS